jgi:hypothetical protein
MAEVEDARDDAAFLGSGFDEQKKPSQLEQSIHAALRQAEILLDTPVALVLFFS